MKKRILSFLLALCLLCSLLPISAFAAPSSQPVYVAFTSDVHSKTTNASDTGHSPYRLNQWLTKVSQAVGATFDNMVFCGDNADGTGASNGDDFWNKVQTVMEVAKSNSSLKGNGLFLAGNHEWKNGDLGKSNHAAAKNIQSVGTTVVTENYVLYLFGASSSDQKGTGFKTEDINKLDAYLSSAPTDKPIFITSHFPIHNFSDRSTANASTLIDTLNKYGDKLDLYFIWGHNHSQSDNNYDKFFDDDDKLLNKSINFVYCAAGCMSDSEYVGSGSVKGKGMVAKIVGGKVESLTYYGTSYSALGSYKPVYSQAPQEPEENYVATGKCGDKLTWTLDDKGTLTVSGTGPMGPWEKRDDVSWHAYLGQITSVVLENGVTTIGNFAFVNAEKLSSITIPRSVTQIGRDAFTFCSSLTKITLPDSITSIGDYAFYACSGLSGISIPNGVTRIGDHTFYGCSSIKKIELSKNITSIDSAAFYACSNLETVLISGVVTIDEHAFDSCSQLKSITFESNAPTLDPLAFNGVKTTCYYPAANASWTEVVKNNYGGTITWVAVCPGHKWNAATCTTPKTCSVCGATDGTAKGHNHTAKVTEPTCTERGYTTYTCTCGDSYVDNYVSATGHNYTAKVTAPTCTQQGYTTHTCKCGDSYVDTYVGASGHNEVTSKGHAATCTEDGRTDGKYCDRCGTVFTQQESITKLGHNWSDWETTREATCSQEGSQRRTCSRCNTQETEKIEKLQHQYESVVTAPTCTAKGYTTYTCSVCKDAYTANEVKALGHNEVTDKGYAATCSETGLTDGKHCDRCNTVLTQQKTIAALGCSFTNYRSNNDATCIADGTKTAACDRGCGATDTITEKDSMDPDNHSLGAWVTEGNKKNRACGLCGYTESSISTDGGNVELEAPEQPNLDFDVEHIDSSDSRYVLVEEALSDNGETDCEVLKAFDITLKNGNNVQVQPNGIVKVKLPLDQEKDGTYRVYRVNDDGTLTDMKAYRQGSHMVFETNHFSLYVIVEEKEHKHTYQQTVTAPTCTAGGYTTYTCECGDSYVSDRVNALGHNWSAWVTDKEATCTQEGSQRRDCSRCDDYETKVIEQLKHQYEKAVTAPTCTEKGYTTYTCSCGDSYVADEVNATGHDYEDGVCGNCGAADPDYQPVEEQFDIDSANMTLGNNLAMNFYVDPANIEADVDYYAQITKTYADGRDDVVVRVDDEDWNVDSSDGFYYFTLNQVAAKEMADAVYVVIYRDEVEDVAVSEVWEDSVRAYAERALKKEEGKPAPDADKLALYVDLLNYGAEAQKYFKYNVEDLANKNLTVAQLAYGQAEVTMTNDSIKGTGYAGMDLVLKSSIILDFYFTSIPDVHDDMYAIASYKNHYGEEKEIKVEGEAFLQDPSDGCWYVPVEGLVVADCMQDVTIRIFDTEGTVIGSAVDSVESYIARISDASPLYVAIMKFAVSAYNSFH